MPTCEICTTVSPEGAVTCPACGEASWVSAPAAVAPAKSVAATDPDAPAPSQGRKSQKPESA